MAEGALDLSSLGQALPSLSPPGETRKAPQPVELHITVLSWNIKGSTQAGMARARELLVPHVVKHVNPDILLLQEIPSDKIINQHVVARARSDRGRSYLSVSAGKRTEARVLFDSRVFELHMPGGAATAVVDLDSVIDEVFPPDREVRAGPIQGEKRVYRDRISAVRLRHKTTGTVIVFMSFHNVRTSAGGVGGVGRMASGFCRMVSTIARKQEHQVVVAGADLNCGHFQHNGARVEDYRPTERRKTKSKVDFVILDWPRESIVHTEISALDFIPDGSTHPFHQVFQDLDRTETEKDRFSVDQYNRSLDHDPLVCRLTVTCT